MAESILKLPNEAAVPKENRLGLKALDYQGGKSTLCAGCGHDAVSNQIVRAFYEMNVKPEKVAKFSGIGCSSKTPAYFLGRAHGFNSVHGRMPAVATGAMLANHQLDQHRRLRRRRHRLDRTRPVHAPGPPQHPDDLHHREQRRVRPDQGPVLRDRG